MVELALHEPDEALTTWALPGEALCCRASQVQGMRPQHQAVTDVLQERTAMIMGMNPKTLRARRKWQMFMWPQKRHWALVLLPFGEPFTARLVDDFVHNAEHCFSAEVPSSRLFLVYEMLLEERDPFIMLSVKPDFKTGRKNVWSLGFTRRMNLLDLQAHALEVAGRYRCYSFIGANCQHFAADLATSLGASRVCPDDETVALAATDTALPVGVVGACVAATAAGAANAPALSWLPALNTVAASASAVGLCGCAALMGVAGLYTVLRDQSRCVCPVVVGGSSARRMLARPASSCLLLSYRHKLASKSMPCLHRHDENSDSEDDEEDVGDGRFYSEDWLASTLVRINP
ncbi:Hypothetical protein (Fragment) [Durusdinium trenchii]|uniref:PPPDE domain-containing protein n=1 Tax=Durusdinium trenchii TaxID=1381693 RepID=A0ABP0QQC8_9DINO